MRLYSVTITAFFLCIIFCSIKDAVFFETRFERRVSEEYQSYSAKKFIAQSFKNACKQKGFENLEQWQLCCRAIFKLEYIGWCQAQDFMIDDFAGGGELMYGKWVASGDIKECSDEVYCRKHRSDF